MFTFLISYARMQLHFVVHLIFSYSIQRAHVFILDFSFFPFGDINTFLFALFARMNLFNK